MAILISPRKFKRLGNAFSIGTTPEPPTPPTPDRYVYSSFDAYSIRDDFSRKIDVSEKGFDYLDMMMVSGVKRTGYLGEEVLTEHYLACGRGYGNRPGTGSGEFLVFIQTNSSNEILNWEAKSREELGSDYNTYRNAFNNSTQMTDEIWNTVSGYFQSVINVTSDSNYIYVDYNEGTPIIIEKSTHNMKYGQNGLWTSDTATEYQTLKSNGWLVDGVYEGVDATPFNTVSSSIKNKSEIVLTITVSTDGGYTTISDGKQSVLYNLSNSKFRYNADYYLEENDSSVLSVFTTNGWLQDGQYNYALSYLEYNQWYNSVDTIKANGIANAIFEHDTVNGDIIVANGDNRIVLADKNIGATQCYGTALGGSTTRNETTMGKIFQAGNNYGFPIEGGFKTSSSPVDASQYGPDNPYSNNEFRINYNGGIRDTSKNKNIWGDITNTDIARKGPCPEGYHVPSSKEWSDLISLIRVIRPNWNANQVMYNLGMGAYVYYDTSGKKKRNDYYALWRTSTILAGDGRCYALSYSTGTYPGTSLSGTSSGYPIRPFKNAN